LKEIFVLFRSYVVRGLGLGSIACALAALSPHPGWAEGRTLAGPRAALSPVAHEVAARSRWVDRMSKQGQRAHGFYFNGPVQRRLGASGIVRVLRGAGMDAAVLDLKDSDGRVGWDTQIPSLKAQRHLFFKDVPAYIAALKQAGIYTIGRIVCFNDPFLPLNEPDRAILDDRPGKQGKVWATWGHRNPWLDPYNTRNHDLIIAMAKEVEALGLDEIQFDYIRFPVDRATRFARFPAQNDTPRPQVLVGMLQRIDEAVHIPIGADVFGVTAFHEDDRDGLGQVPEDWQAHVEVFTPMLYLDGMASWGSHRGPGRAERLIYAAIKNLRRRVGSGPVLRPFLQAYARRADYYNEQFIAEQIRATRDAGGDGFLFWSPGSSYKMVQSSMATAAAGLMPFPIDERFAWRARAWGEADATPVPGDDGAEQGVQPQAGDSAEVVSPEPRQVPRDPGLSAPSVAVSSSPVQAPVDVTTRPSQRAPQADAAQH
jgi:hypothetical protein